MIKRFLVSLVALFAVGLSACTNDADVASHNISRAADQFEINRRIVFYNGITDTYILSVEGLCSIGNDNSAIEMSVTCKTGSGQYVKHYLGRADNVTYFAEQLRTANVSTSHYKVIFKPSVIIPDVDIR